MPDDPQIWTHILLGYIHDLSIAVYFGGAVAMEFVLGPAQASIPPAQAQVMGQKTASRFLWRHCRSGRTRFPCIFPVDTRSRPCRLRRPGRSTGGSSGSSLRWPVWA